MANDKVKLGLMPPLTGLVALYGEEISRAAEIAVMEVNSNGGVLGRELELLIEDDGSLPETALPAALRLVEKGCSAIIGNLLSNSRIAVASQVAAVKKIPYLNFSFYEGSIYNPYFFHFAALPNQQIEKMIPYMADKFGQKFFFAGSNYEWPRGSIDAGKSVLNSLGGEVVGEEYLPIGSTNIVALLDKVKRSGADVFVPYFAGQDQINLLTSFTAMGLKSKMAVVMGHYDEAMVSQLDPDVREGFYSSNTYFMQINTPENINIRSRIIQFPNVSGIWPEGNGILTNFGEGTYICVRAFVEAVNKAGSLETEEILGALRKIEINAPQGKVSMNPATQHATVNSYLARCNRDGSFSVIESFGTIFPVIPERYNENYKMVITNNQKMPTNEQLAIFEKQQGYSDEAKILEIMDIALIVIDSVANIVYVNRHACELFKYESDELIGKSINTLLPPRFRFKHSISIQHFLMSDETDRRMGHRSEIAGYTRNGEEFPAQASISKIKTNSGILMCASLKDISERKKIQAELSWKANHDPLTKLPNRVLMKERIIKALERTLRNGYEVALLFIDLDGFKLINDNYGHDEGDRLLGEVAERLVNGISPGDTVSRFGGDEFVVLCENVKEQEETFTIANRLIEILRAKFEIDGRDYFFSGSIGLAFGNGFTHNADELLKNADIAMYEAKGSGRDNWKIFSLTLEESVKSHLRLANGLRHALENSLIQAYLQPIYDITGTKLLGGELLSRWFDQGNFIPPDQFIPVAEKSGIIVEMGYYIFREGCRAQVRSAGIAQDNSSPFISINVSARQLDDPNFVNKFHAILIETGADASQVILEITESSLMSNSARNLEILARLKELGLNTAVDDFGTGYSSLSHLSKMTVKKLKIDKSFIDDVHTMPEQRSIVAAIIMMAKTMGIEVVAEGVETEIQLQILKELDCDSIQGYIFSKPLTVQDFMKLLK